MHVSTATLGDGFVLVAAAGEGPRTSSGMGLIRPAYTEREIAESIRETFRLAPLVRSSTADRELKLTPLRPRATGGHLFLRSREDSALLNLRPDSCGGRATMIVAAFQSGCPGCGANREAGARYVLGPDPLRPKCSPLFWDIECLRNCAWLREVVRYSPKS